MDFFELLIIALIALPALLRWIEQSRKKADGADSSEVKEAAPQRNGVQTEFERALREIGLTLQGKPLPKESPPERGAPEQTDSKRQRPERDRRVSHAGFLREEQFEGYSRMKQAGQGLAFRELKPVQIVSPYTKRRSTVSRRTRNIRRQLRQSSRTRQAILLAEILRPPLALRRSER